MVSWRRLPAGQDRYVFIKKLAEGGMADVFLARDTASSPPRLCVVKRLLPDLRSSKDHVGMFLDECDLAVRLVHPNIVRTLDRGSNRDGPFLVLEYLAGFDLDLVLARLVQQGAPMPWHLAVHVCARTAEAMQYAHALTTPEGKPLNLIHRDLTPSNIFITFDGLVKVLDFGIARAEERRTRTSAGMLKGKARYLAPELIRQKAVDGRVDEFSLGCALYESLALEPMFSGDNELAVIHAILEGSRPSLIAKRTDVPPELQTAFRKMTARDPDERFATMGEVAAALQATMPAGDHRVALSTLLREQFAPDFEAHATLMARLAVASVTELQAHFEKDGLVKPTLEKTRLVSHAEVPPEARRTPMSEPTKSHRADAEPGRPRPVVAVRPADADATDPARVIEPSKPLELPSLELPGLDAVTEPARPLRLPDEGPPPLAPLPGTRAPSKPTVAEPARSPNAWVIAVLVAVALVVAVVLLRRPPATPVVGPGTVVVRSTPPGATIRVDTQRSPSTTPAVLSLSPGPHTLVLEHDDCLPAEVAVTVTEGAKQTIDVLIPPKEALLVFNVRPADAVVTVDGVSVQLTDGSGSSVPLGAGAHEVEVRALGYLPYRQSFNVTDGMRLPVEVELRSDPNAQRAP